MSLAGRVRECEREKEWSWIESNLKEVVVVESENVSLPPHRVHNNSERANRRKMKVKKARAILKLFLFTFTPTISVMVNTYLRVPPKIALARMWSTFQRKIIAPVSEQLCKSVASTPFPTKSDLSTPLEKYPPPPSFQSWGPGITP